MPQLIKVTYNDNDGNHFSSGLSYYTVRDENDKEDMFRTPFVIGSEDSNGNTDIVLCWPESRLWAIYRPNGILKKLHVAGPPSTRAYVQFIVDENENVVEAMFCVCGNNKAVVKYDTMTQKVTDVSFSHEAFGNWQKGQPALNVGEIFRRCDVYCDEIRNNVTVAPTA